MNIPLGYEVGTGHAVRIPLNHMAVIGQTQQSGKTTTLEALVTRSRLRAIAFITKPGEKSFRLQTAIPAFFSESTSGEYWQYVVAMVESHMKIKLGWRERGWVIKLCRDYERKGKTKAQSYGWKRPKVLRDLLANVEAAMPHLRGQDEMMCIQLQEYLKPAVREIERTKFSDKLKLSAGINVMDVSGLSSGVQALVIRSVIEWVHKHERKIIMIIPEAWQFIPEGRGTPVKLALELLIRQGAGVENFVWIDSQDLRGVDKLLLRSVIVWLFGVQRQRNEVASTLDSIPDNPKPTASEIMKLGRGEFYVCYGTTLVRTYVQPAGMEDEQARAIARGDESPETWKQIERALDAEEENLEEAVPSEEGARDYDPEIDGPISEITDGGAMSGRPGDLRAEDSTVEKTAGATSGSKSGDEWDEFIEEDHVWKEKYDALKVEYDELVQRVQKLEGRIRSSEDAGETVHAAAPNPAKQHPASASNGIRVMTGEELEAIYTYIKNRAAQDDPGILQLLVERPELRVQVQRRTIDAEATTMRGRLALLLSQGFFDSPQNGNVAFKELKRQGFPCAKPNVYRELDKLSELGFVTAEESGYQAVSGMKVYIEGDGAAQVRGKEAAAAGARR